MDINKSKQIRDSFETLEVEESRFVDNQMFVAAQIQNGLERKGWSQNKLSRESGLNENVIRQIIAGEGNPTLKTISAIEQALSEEVIVAPDFFMEELEEKGVIISESNYMDFSFRYTEELSSSMFAEGAEYSFEFNKKNRDQVEYIPSDNMHLLPKAS
jgi:transcriptional regulator with XRE-family HTH domain